MNITLPQNELKDVATAFNRIVPRRITIPSLGCLLVHRGNDNTLRMTGTNLDETLTLKIVGSQTDEPMDPFLVPLEELRRLVKLLKKSDTLSIAPNTARDLIECSIDSGGQSTTSRVSTIPPEEFPDIPTGSQTARAVAPLAGFLQAYRIAAVSASTDETRHVLNGVLWDAEEGVLVGTDGKRLTSVVVPDFGLEGSLIVPKTKFLLKQSFEDGLQADFRTFENDERMAFSITCERWEYRTRCIDGTYPNYRQVIPPRNSGFSGCVRVDEKDVSLLIGAIDRLAGDASDHPIVIYARPDCVALIGPQVIDSGNDAPDVHLVLPHSIYEPEESETAIGCLNGVFLKECVQNGFHSLRISGKPSPWLAEGDTGVYVIMPLKVDPTDMVQAYAATRLAAPAVQPLPEPVSTPTVETPTTPSAKPFPVDAFVKAPQSQKEKPVTTPNTPIPIENADPMETLAALVDRAQEHLREANNAIREVKRTAKEIERDYRNRDKQLASREREFEKSAKVIARLQEAIAA